MKLVILAALAATLAACGNVSKWKAGIAGFDRICISGVYYLQFPSGVTAELTAEGKPRTCTL